MRRDKSRPAYRHEMAAEYEATANEADTASRLEAGETGDVGTNEGEWPFVVGHLCPGGDHMKKVLLAGATAMALIMSGQAFAQSVSVEIVPEQRTRIKEYVVREKVPRVTVKERYRVGTTVPADVELREVPADWGPSVHSYRYYHTDEGVHFVDPASRRVIYDID